MANGAAEAGQGCAGPENSARCHVRTWYLSSQGPQGGSWGGGHAPARQGALTAAIAATPARFYHSKHLQHTTISSTHAGGHAHTCRWGRGMPPWEVARGQLQRGQGETGKTPRYKNPKWPYLWRPHVCDAGFDASSVPHGSGCLAVRSHSDPRRPHEHQ